MHKLGGISLVCESLCGAEACTGLYILQGPRLFRVLE